MVGSGAGTGRTRPAEMRLGSDPVFASQGDHARVETHGPKNPCITQHMAIQVRGRSVFTCPREHDAQRVALRPTPRPSLPPPPRTPRSRITMSSATLALADTARQCLLDVFKRVSDDIRLEYCSFPEWKAPLSNEALGEWWEVTDCLGPLIVRTCHTDRKSGGLMR